MRRIILFISDLVKKPSCLSDKEQEAEFIHSLNVCLSSYTHAVLTAPKHKMCPRSLQDTHSTSAALFIYLFIFLKLAPQNVF